ncbi:MAG TPA: OpgC domain-containing protein [Opitutaceae bacterium]
MVKSKPETSQKKRDLRFDTLRGLFLVCMTINHLPTELRTVTDQSIGVFSAAEGFVFLSGLIAGWVYTRKLRAAGEIWSASLARSKTIYLWHVASFLASFVCVQLVGHLFGFCSTTSPRLFYEHPVASLGLGFSLLYQPGLLDLLPMYCAFVLLLPSVIGSLEAGHRWRALAISGAVWFAAQLAPPLAGVPLGLINTGTFNLFAWQFLFVAGIAIGHARASGRAQVARPSPWVVAGAAAIAAYGLGIRHAGWLSLWPDRIYGILLNKPALGLLRIADFGSVAYLVAILGERFPRLLTFRPLALLGRRSLAVVAVQTVVVLGVLQFSALFSTALDRTLTAAGVIALLFAAAAAHERLAPAAPPIRTRQHRRRRILRSDGVRTA